MIKRTLFFLNPLHLSIKNAQLAVRDKNTDIEKIIPSEDIGYVVLDNKQLTYTHSVLQMFAENNVAVIVCDDKHMPKSMLINFDSNHLEGQFVDYQINASDPLKKNLWKQTIKQKIRNQAQLLYKLGKNGDPLIETAKNVKSGDSTNREGLAAKIYWQKLMENFNRSRYGIEPNSMLNYGYAILRSITAKAITGSGLLPVIGIHHHNKYNAYRLADDIMEPYRPYVDEIVLETYAKFPDYEDLTVEIKSEILKIITADVKFDKVKRPLSIGLSMTSASLANCFKGEQRKISYPAFE